VSDDEEEEFSDKEVDSLLNELLEEEEENAPLTDDEIEQIVSQLLDDDEDE
jgi:DNA-directed RNA polymerase specialized sigma54-like protein